MANKAINDLLKYGMRKWISPEMMSDSQNGYTCTNDTGGGYCTPYYSFTTFNSTTRVVVTGIYATFGTLRYHSLRFPSNKAIFINKLRFPLATGNYGYGLPSTSYWTLIGYLNGNVVFTQTGNPSSIIDIPLTRCDRIYISAFNNNNPDQAGWSPFRFEGYEMG